MKNEPWFSTFKALASPLCAHYEQYDLLYALWQNTCP